MSPVINARKWQFEVSNVPELSGAEARSFMFRDQTQPFVLRGYQDNVETFVATAEIWTKINGRVTVLDSVDHVVRARAGHPGDHRIVEMPFCEIFERIRGVGTHPPIVEEGERYYVFGNSVPPELAALVTWPEEGGDRLFIYVTAQGVVTRAHYDTNAAVLIQFSGRKHLLLFSPVYFHNMYPIHDLDSGRDRRSLVDIRSPDLEQHPLIRDVQAMETTLEPGDAIFLPSNWWHEVEALSLSISTRVDVANVASSRLEEIFAGLRECNTKTALLPPEQQSFVRERIRVALDAI